REKDGSACKEGIGLLRQVLAKRAPDEDLDRLLSQSNLERVIKASGGLFRDLFRMVAALLLKSGELPLGTTEIDNVERQHRATAATGLSKEQWEILADVQQTNQLLVPRELSAEAWGLQALGAVLCYRNGSVDWYGVHPLLDPLVPGPDTQS
ncbi:MAG: hypothetical protein CSA83_01060, partial [Actinomycetales bacterium]